MKLLEMSVSGAVLICAITLVRALTLHVLPKRAFRIFWLIVLARLLIPFPPLLRVSLPQFPVERLETVRLEQTDRPAAAAQGERSTLPPTVRTDGNGAVNQTRTAESARNPEEASAAPSWTELVIWIWAAGAAFTGLFFLTAYAAGYWKLRQAYPVEHDAVKRWRAAHPMRRKYAVKSFGDASSPITCGVLRPVILAPGAVEWWSSPAAKFALEHEYVHMRRLDAAVKFAMALALSLHWFNPAVWLFYALANRDIEFSCDEAVLLRFGPQERAAYARALLDAEERRWKPPVLYAGFGVNTTRERIEEIMKYQKKSLGNVVLAVLLALALAACAVSGTEQEAQGVRISGESLDLNDLALRPDGEAAQIYENAGLRLLVPLEYNGLVTVSEEQEGALFSVSEKASIDAAEKQGETEWGPGWLFSIGTVTEDELHEMLCYDMSGAEVFARDEDGRYYLYCHPTDVRFVRESYEDIDEDMAQWTTLNEWASTVPDNFIAENPGLTPEKHGNTDLDMYLARAAYLDGVKYTISATEYGPMDGSGFDALRYVSGLTSGVTFETVDDSETPDGEYIVLSFPDDDIRFEFFLKEDEQSYIRQVWSGNNRMLYKAVFEDGTPALETGNIMSEWYRALAAENLGDALDESGFTGEDFVGEWQDEVSQRAVMSIKTTDEAGVYDVVVHWGSSFDSAVQWRMRASAGAQDEILSYENGLKVELNFSEGEAEQETVVWENGTGYFMFRDGYLTWYDEQQPEAAQCRFVRAE